MYSSDADKKSVVVNYFEALLVFVVFAFVLYVLYPKEMLYKQVLSENSNYDLTAVYLENMLRLEPENKSLILPLIKTSLKTGKYDLALKMITVLKKDADPVLQKELLKFELEALKVKYFSTNEKKLQAEVREQIALFLDGIIRANSFDTYDLEYWYKVAREFSINKPALFFLYRLIEQEKRAEWLQECFYLSHDLKDEKLQADCLQKLRKIDVSRYEEWTQQAYYLALKDGKTEQAISLLKEMAKRSLKWQKELAKVYVELRMYKKGSQEYISLYRHSKSSKEKKQYFIKALDALQYGALLDDAAELARKYEALYYRDKQMSTRLIKLYLSAGKLDDAKRVSIERLKYME